MLKIENLKYQYGNHSVLKGISCELFPGKVYGILGKNGSGKTTLFRNIFGYLNVQDGSIKFNNTALNKEDIAFLETQNFYYPYIKASEHLDLVSPNIKKYLAVAESFDLPLDEYVDEYSTGMKKKLSFLASLSLERPIMLLDEPYNGVDLMSNELILNILSKIKKDKIILMSSHILSTLTDVCDEIFILDEGVFVQHYLRNDFSNLALSIKEEISQKSDSLKF